MSTNPAKLLGIDKGSLEVGKVADITIVDPNEEYLIDANSFVSKSKTLLLMVTKLKGKLNIQL